jgi:hypothetical protein
MEEPNFLLRVLFAIDGHVEPEIGGGGDGGQR